MKTPSGNEAVLYTGLVLFFSAAFLDLAYAVAMAVTKHMYGYLIIWAVFAVVCVCLAPGLIKLVRQTKTINKDV
jgi:membrane protein YdbS with pleckstrin-like domain